MDYEKKYNEALERAKQFEKKYGGGYAALIFPELRESEDERIRKWIVNLLHELHYNQTAQPMALKAIEWLEKQKEQKPVEVKDPFSNANFVRGYESGYNDAIREQKPAEWSEEDEHRRTDAIYFLESAKRHYADTSEIEAAICWITELRPSWKPSEEQMAGLLVAIGDEKERGSDVVNPLRSLYYDLKKLM